MFGKSSNRRVRSKKTYHGRVIRLTAERLDDRVMPVVAAFNVPQALTPSKSWAGVVLIRQSPDDVGGASGTLLPSGQHILTAAHVLDADGDKVPDSPYYYVNFDLPAGRVQMVVPSNRITINPEWLGATEQGFKNGHDVAIMQLSGISPWGNGPGSLGFQLYTGQPIEPGVGSPSNLLNIVGYGYVGDGYIGQNTSDNSSQIASTVQVLMLPPTATGSFSLRNSTTKSSIRLDAKGLTADIVENAIESLDPSGFTDVEVSQRLEKGDPYFGSFDIVFRNVDTNRYPKGDVPKLSFRPQSGFRGGSQRKSYRTGIMRPAYPTQLGTKTSASTYFNIKPEDMPNVSVTQLSTSPRLAILGEGDSGGPALLKRQIVGVASFYSGDSQFSDYSGWSQVSTDLSWIKANTNTGGELIVDLATQPVTIGNARDYVTVQVNKPLDNLIVFAHGRAIFQASASDVSSVRIVSRGVPTQYRTIGDSSLLVHEVQNSQKGFLSRVEKVAILGQTATSPAVVMSKNSGEVPTSSVNQKGKSTRSTMGLIAKTAMNTIDRTVKSVAKRIGKRF